MSAFTATFTVRKSPIQASLGDTADPISINIGTGATSTDYEALRNKPQINGCTLIGDKSLDDIGAQSLTNMELLSIINQVKGV